MLIIFKRKIELLKSKDKNKCPILIVISKGQEWYN
jgi:hypothetical protein